MNFLNKWFDAQIQSEMVFVTDMSILGLLFVCILLIFNPLSNFVPWIFNSKSPFIIRLLKITTLHSVCFSLGFFIWSIIKDYY